MEKIKITEKEFNKLFKEISKNVVVKDNCNGGRSINIKLPNNYQVSYSISNKRKRSPTMKKEWLMKFYQERSNWFEIM